MSELSGNFSRQSLSPEDPELSGNHSPHNDTFGLAPFRLAGPSSSRFRHAQSAILFVMFFLALGGNCAVICKLWSGRVRSGAKKLSNISLLYLQLAVADLIAAVCCILSNAILYLIQHFLAGNFFCKVLRFSQRLGLATSTFIVVAIGMDRCLALLFPLRRAQLRWGVKLMIVLAWVSGALFSLPQVFIFQVNIFHSDEGSIFQCDNSVGYTARWQEMSYDLMHLIFLYIGPIVIIGICYGKIIRAMGVEAAQAKNGGYLSTPTTANPPAMQPRTSRFEHARLTSLKVSIFVISTFMLCWTPYYCSLVYHIIHRPPPHDDYYYNHAIYFCGLGHSVVNPIVYGAYHFFQRSKASRRTTGSMRTDRVRTMSSSSSRMSGFKKLASFHSLRRSPTSLTS
ncbi:hypothetical protein RvY_01226 [Ramazzottius varieornatus]|uniref:G-protein coupled receptors family 1 profile domain-containing protein n=1 Tax=Ramazzottius varieornatus TaxID=947166 RepID=A0A1D1UQA3_RAMVA|nr:hypothetical protein RvY_01226 [Ramazzottius varieornatus]